MRRFLYRYMGRSYAVYRLFAFIRERTIGNARLYRRRTAGARDARPPMMIFMCDTQEGVNGGLTDRLRGMVSMHALCEREGWRLGIWFDTPFRLEDCLQPAGYDWRVARGELGFDRAVPVFCQNYVAGRATEFGLRYLRSAMKRHGLIHVYTNLCFSWEEFAARFGELFRPSPALESLLESNLQAIGGQYVAAVFRFQQLLGDFYEGGPSMTPTLPPERREELVSRCLECIGEIHARTGGHVLVTSDSEAFLRRAASAFGYVYVIPGRVVHLDFTKGEDVSTYMKSFVDFYMLGRSREVSLVVGGGMYRSGFARAAALAGGAPYREIDF